MATVRRVKGAWRLPGLAGGCPQHASWCENPQYELHPTSSGSFTFSLQQPPCRNMAPIGVMVLLGIADEPLTPPLQASQLVAKSTFKATTEQRLEVQLEAGRCYVVVPTTFSPGVTGEFVVEVSASVEFSLEERRAVAPPAPEPKAAGTQAPVSAQAPAPAQSPAQCAPAEERRWVEIGEAAGGNAAEPGREDDGDDSDLPGRFVEVEDPGHAVFQAAGNGRLQELQALLERGKSVRQISHEPLAPSSPPPHTHACG